MLHFQGMKQLIFSTGNNEKFTVASHASSQYGIELRQQPSNRPEIQEENPELVALDKAYTAFQVIGKPLVITDDSWSFAGLNGFPGVYMHSINSWFTAEDFLRLTMGLEDRSVLLTSYLVYIDQQQQKVFSGQTKGELLKESKGSSEHASHTIITMDGDNGLSIAEAYEQAADKSTRTSAQIWHDFAIWYSQA
jgi:XTP/dITP diphosphohydrolase